MNLNINLIINKDSTESRGETIIHNPILKSNLIRCILYMRLLTCMSTKILLTADRFQRWFRLVQGRFWAFRSEEGGRGGFNLLNI